MTVLLLSHGIDRGRHKGPPRFKGKGHDTTTQWEEYQDSIVRKACGMGDTVVTIFEKYNLPQSTLWPQQFKSLSYTKYTDPLPETSKAYPIMDRISP